MLVQGLRNDTLLKIYQEAALDINRREAGSNGRNTLVPVKSGRLRSRFRARQLTGGRLELTWQVPYAQYVAFKRNTKVSGWVGRFAARLRELGQQRIRQYLRDLGG